MIMVWKWRPSCLLPGEKPPSTSQDIWSEERTWPSDTVHREPLPASGTVDSRPCLLCIEGKNVDIGLQRHPCDHDPEPRAVKGVRRTGCELTCISCMWYDSRARRNRNANACQSSRAGYGLHPLHLPFICGEDEIPDDIVRSSKKRPAQPIKDPFHLFLDNPIYMTTPELEAIRGQSSAASLPTGPVMAEPFISPLGLTMTPALSSK